MTDWKPGFTLSRGQPRLKKFCPYIEALEDRCQPSLTALALDGTEAHSFTGFQHLDGVVHTAMANGVQPMLTLATATYITGTTGSATGRGIALGQDGSSYETGTITLAGSEEAYIAKYDANGKQVYFVPFQLMDNANTLLRTEGNGVAVDGAGNVYVAGTVVDATSLSHGYASKFSADGSTLLWTGRFRGPSTGDGIAVYDPNHDGNGQAVVTGTLTVTDATLGRLGDHAFAARVSVDGMSLDYELFYTFGTDDDGSHGNAIALNINSTNSTPGSLAYIAGNIVFDGNQQILAAQIDNGNDTNVGSLIWSRTLSDNIVTPNTDTLTGVAVNPDDSSVYSGTAAASASEAVGIVVGYPADGGPLGQQPPILSVLQGHARSLNAITVDSAGNIYTAGAAANPSSLGGIYVASLDNKGRFIADVQFGDVGMVDAGYDIVATGSGSLWAVGDTTSSTLSTDGTTLNGTQDGWLAAISIP
jgi:hypothetical protein